MQLNGVDSGRLQQLLRPFMDEIVAARVQLDMSTEVMPLTADREELERRLVLAFTEIEPRQMPTQWSWEKTAVTIAGHITHKMIAELHERAGGRE